jgi:hypothetical protein
MYRKMTEPKYSYLPVVDKKEFSKLYEMLEKIKLPIKAPNTLGRAQFTEKHRACSWGMSYHFTRQVIHEKSRMSKKHPEIHDELMRLSKVVCPNHPFTTIYMNRNIQCEKHKDKSNVGELVIVSFGEYEGGDLFIEGERCSAKHHPIKFDGTTQEHWNPKDLVGTKYSLVFFTHKAIIKAIEKNGGTAQMQ